MEKLIVSWDKAALDSLHKIFDYIKQDSISNAEKIADGIDEATKSLSSNPFKHPADKFKINNNGDYRAFEKYSYRIAYKVDEKEIIILRIRHVKQEPLTY